MILSSFFSCFVWDCKLSHVTGSFDNACFVSEKFIFEKKSRKKLKLLQVFGKVKTSTIRSVKWRKKLIQFCERKYVQFVELIVLNSERPKETTTKSNTSQLFELNFHPLLLHKYLDVFLFYCPVVFHTHICIYILYIHRMFNVFCYFKLTIKRIRPFFEPIIDIIVNSY